MGVLKISVLQLKGITSILSTAPGGFEAVRSEERRVGKEC